MWRSLLMLLMFASSAIASEPVFDAIDYATPSKYLTSPSSLGDQKAITAQARAFKADRDRETVLNVLNWMQANLKYQADLAYHWRNYDTVIREGCYGSCADYAIACGVLLKSAGIPTVWVKTMDVPWIWDLKKGRPFRTWSGHVYLEIYIDKKWVLLDPGAKKIYVDYSPKARILPGNRFAYHKGNDPKEMIMSLQWEAWKRQTEKYFSQLDQSMLPVNTVTEETLGLKCFVIGNSPYYQIMTKSARQKGLTVVKSFNTQYDTFLPQAKGHTLYIQTKNGMPIVSIAKLEQYFPNASAGLQSKSRSIEVADTNIVFTEFSNSQNLEEMKRKLLKEKAKLNAK
ncbi:transglutaminase domain-containing protein [uncultured Gimesia sp.]|uniref:transglutaminase-like domain-containing protein n=1 Tax=uncultured Gimesia sp. TaxID=1678688 RepID=UPI002622A10C|nr:transglutaminase domain-containing protein [uncultured Gimesia sp.]